jgi:predicted GNAT family acetyltransferase
MEVTITDDTAAHRYVITADGTTAGEIVYGFRQGRRVLLHTAVDPELQGTGIAGAAVAALLDRSRQLGERVVPLCGFVTAYIAKHPEYDDLVDHDLLASLARSPSP